VKLKDFNEEGAETGEDRLSFLLPLREKVAA
jgi:hypothetical protein